MMEVTLHITNSELFEQKVDQVDLNGLSEEAAAVFNGLIRIYTRDGRIVPFYGLIEADDFESDFGFVLKAGAGLRSPQLAAVAAD